MIAQVHEMLYIEKGGDEQVADELAAYNPLIHNGKELVSTLMFEIDNPIIRAEFLGKLGGVENNIFIKVGDEKIYAVPEMDVIELQVMEKHLRFSLYIFSFQMIR